VGTSHLILFLFLAKETKGKPLEEIAGLFGDTVVATTMTELIRTHDAEIESSLDDGKAN
jgi:hypothetical protein